jgi:hypothetical protein
MREAPVRPKGVEELLDVVDVLLEKYPNGLVPYEESVVLTHELIHNICERLLATEKGMFALMHKAIKDDYEEYKKGSRD